MRVVDRMAVQEERSVKSVFVASFFAVVVAGAALPAAAEPLPPASAGLPPYEIVAMLRAAGFEPVIRPVRGAGVFFVRAFAPDDADVRVTVDARTGRILEVQPMGYAGPPFIRGYRLAAPRFSYGPSVRSHDATGALPVPPRGVPGARSAPPADHRKAVTPPLPRPRPGETVASAPARTATPQPTEAVAAAPAKPPETAAPATDRIEFPPVTPLE
jgi:hypothetical protein